MAIFHSIFEIMHLLFNPVSHCHLLLLSRPNAIVKFIPMARPKTSYDSKRHDY